jgi:hypothetical protein
MRGATTTTVAASLSRSRHSKHWPANHQFICSAVCVLLAAKERADSVPDVVWVCAWCFVLRNIA